MIYTSSIESARKKALSLAKENNEPFHIIKVYGYGYTEVSNQFALNRQYFHSREGKKMRFGLIETVMPNGSRLTNEPEKRDDLPGSDFI